MTLIISDCLSLMQRPLEAKSKESLDRYFRLKHSDLFRKPTANKIAKTWIALFS